MRARHAAVHRAGRHPTGPLSRAALPAKQAACRAYLQSGHDCMHQGFVPAQRMPNRRNEGRGALVSYSGVKLQEDNVGGQSASVPATLICSCSVG